MGQPNEAAEHTVTVEPICEVGISGTTDDVTLVPIGTRFSVEQRPQPLAIELCVGRRSRFPKELPELKIAGERPYARKLQLEQREMGLVEVDRVDLRRLRSQIGQRVAAAGGDGNDRRPRRQL